MRTPRLRRSALCLALAFGLVALPGAAEPKSRDAQGTSEAKQPSGTRTVAAKRGAKPRAAASAAKRRSKRSTTTKKRALPAGYRAHVRRWHERAPDAHAPLDEASRPKLVIESINLQESVELSASSDEGGFSESELERAARVLRDAGSERAETLEPELLDLLYRIQTHFDAPCIRVVSAYRSPKRNRASQHSRGRAADIVVPGVEDRAVAAWVRSLGATGVGLYPVSGFVHVDVREASHYWVDSSGPGQRSNARRARPKKTAKKGR